MASEAVYSVWAIPPEDVDVRCANESATVAVGLARKRFPGVECKWGDGGLEEIIQDGSIETVAVVLAGQNQLSRNSEKKKRKQVMATKVPQIAILGAGIFVKTVYIPKLAEISHLFHLKAIWSRTQGSATAAVEIASEHFTGVESKWGDSGLEEIIQDGSIDAVAIVLAGQNQALEFEGKERTEREENDAGGAGGEASPARTAATSQGESWLFFLTYNGRYTKRDFGIRTTLHVGCLSATLVGCSVPCLDSDAAGVRVRDAAVEVGGAARRGGGAGGAGGCLVDPVSSQFPVSVHITAVPAVPVKDRGDSCYSCFSELGFCLSDENWDRRGCTFHWFLVVALGFGNVRVYTLWWVPVNGGGGKEDPFLRNEKLTGISELETALSSYQSISAGSPGQLIWSVAENFRFESGLIEGKKLIAGIGKIITINLIMEASMPTSNPYYSTSWRHSFPGGYLLDMGVHFVAALRLIVGSEVASVSARTAHVDLNLPPPDTISSVFWRMEVQECFQWLSTPKHPRQVFSWRFVGLNGTLHIEQSFEGEEGYLVSLHGADGQVKSSFFPSDGVIEELKAFLSDVSEKTLKQKESEFVGEPRLSFVEGARDVAVLEAVFESGAKQGEVVQFNVYSAMSMLCNNQLNKALRIDEVFIIIIIITNVNSLLKKHGIILPIGKPESNMI
ncbi:hypothetical protein V8G54_002486 [Vigna mungo]|uniref:GFO/IDH/MocA-like oxidoreductase domain-containing protein n=1 Tax=Vigna mungo TaxID=3915 RepID=A0AAQ3SAV7_VIGMU